MSAQAKPMGAYRTSKSRMKRRKAFYNCVLYALLFLLAIATLFPLLWAVSGSFRTDIELHRYALPFTYRTLIPVEPTVANYVRLFEEFNFLRAITNTVVQVLILVPLGIFINSVAAFSFSLFDFKFKNVLFVMFLISFMIPFESIALPLYNVVDAFGWVDSIYAMIIPSVANGLVLFLFRQFFRDLPIEFFESARVDGASWGRIYTKIVFPLSLPIFITAGLMLFITYWNAYLWPLLVARSPNVFTIQIALARLRMENETLWAALYGGSVISALIPLMIFLPFQRYFVEGITSGGIKG